MSYSGRIETVYSEAFFHSNTRGVIRIPDGVYVPGSLRLLNVGLYDDTTAALKPGQYGGTASGLSCGGLGLYYPTNVGTDAIMKNIQLKYGGALFCQNVAYPLQWLTINKMCTSNDRSRDINRNIYHSGWGFSLNSSGAYTLQPTNQDYTTNLYVQSAAGVNTTLQSTNDQIRIAFSESNTVAQTPGSSGQYFCSNHLEPLRDMAKRRNPDGEPFTLPLKNATLTYNFDNRQYYVDPAGSAYATNLLRPIRPVFAGERLIGVDPYDFEIDYVDLKPSMFKLPSAADGTPQSVTVRDQNLKGEYLVDTTYFKDLSTAGGVPNNLWMLPGCRSVAQTNERFNMQVNNAIWLQSKGIDTPTAALMSFQQVHRRFLNIPLASAMTSFTDAGNALLDATTRSVIGNMSLAAISVGRIINDVRHMYTRTCGATADLNSRLNIICFNRVRRVMAFVAATGKIAIAAPYGALQI